MAGKYRVWVVEMRTGGVKYGWTAYRTRVSAEVWGRENVRRATLILDPKPKRRKKNT